ncbi:murein DD-endopeptidase MepM/ murein hydrolase activator NlpD [Rhodovulum iodosum]|uniref:Murein DD-endopeptidase MepM/ murein hydrolase activator NlpD n=1 Tax=Rhodovulum iodosum TaxID=68291 RepID=A0ABV3XV76_9RHOB|nr:peptidoglycan DD-metalloendopeptidase family protein [Rhodovulum robiginosum]
MPARTRITPLCTAALGLSLAVLAGCSEGFDYDFRPGGAGTAEAVQLRSAARPEADNRGVISYPTYQVAVARRGDTVADVAARVGLPANELGRYNGIAPDVPLNSGEIIALPRRVAEPSPATGAPATGAIRPAGEVDIATLAGDAIERADGGRSTAAPARAAPTGPEPVRHKVERGETAYSIARLYNVSVRALADWNGLGQSLTVREGQFLLIPVPAADMPAAAPAQATVPGTGSPTPTPPSAAAPLPEDEETAAEAAPAPASPALDTEKTTTARMQMPVTGNIIRGYEKRRNEGIDIAAAPGAAVLAADNGTVAAITRDTEQVPILVIRHSDNLLSVYANIQSIAVQKGDTVRRGQKVAEVRAGDPSFLHFELRRGIESTDPMPYLN